MLLRNHPFNLKVGGYGFFGVKSSLFAMRRSGIFFRDKFFSGRKCIQNIFSAHVRDTKCFPLNLLTEFFLSQTNHTPLPSPRLQVKWTVLKVRICRSNYLQLTFTVSCTSPKQHWRSQHWKRQNNILIIPYFLNNLIFDTHC